MFQSMYEHSFKNTASIGDITNVFSPQRMRHYSRERMYMVHAQLRRVKLDYLGLLRRGFKQSP